MMTRRRLDGSRVYVMGLGRFGGGVGVSRYLAKLGARVVVGDTENIAALADSVAALQDLIDDGSVTLAMGPHDTKDLIGVDMLVVNPAVPKPWKNSFIAHAKSLGITVTTEIEITYRLLDHNKVIAVTGSAGKSTTCAMIHHGLSHLGHQSVLGGNIGGSLLSDLDAISDGAIVVLELSSAMLHWLGESQAMTKQQPLVGCIGNCVPNHLDWHENAEHYEQSKRVLARCAKHLILGPSVADWKGQSEIISENDWLPGCSVPGRHNGINAAIAALAIGLMVKNTAKQIADAVKTFEGLPHRLELVHVSDGIRFFNDSKCTVPDATVLAVEAIEERIQRSKIHLIVGGHDKGSNLSAISKMGSELAGLYGIGKTGAGLVNNAASENAFDCGDLDQAMKSIASRLHDGDAVLLSPGCASWDQFANYEERGDLFTKLARAMAV